MAYNKQPTRATDAYQYFSCPGSEIIQLQVFNNTVDVAFGRTTGNQGPETATYPFVDEFYVPGSSTIPQLCDAIRIKNHVRGISAEYSISARLASELPQGVPLSTGTVPYYLRLEGGRISADFSGHIRAQGIEIPVAEFSENPEGNNQITWQRGETIEHEIYGFANPTSTIRGLILGVGHNTEGTIRSGLQITETNPEARGRFLSFNSRLILDNRLLFNRTFLDQEQRSSWLQWLNAGAGNTDKRQILIGTTRVTATVTGQGAYEFTMSGAFPTRCERIMCSTVGVETAWPIIRGCIVSSRERGTVVLESTTRQTIELLYIAIGE